MGTLALGLVSPWVLQTLPWQDCLPVERPGHGAAGTLAYCSLQAAGHRPPYLGRGLVTCRRARTLRCRQTCILQLASCRPQALPWQGLLTCRRARALRSRRACALQIPGGCRPQASQYKGARAHEHASARLHTADSALLTAACAAVASRRRAAEQARNAPLEALAAHAYVLACKRTRLASLMPALAPASCGGDALADCDRARACNCDGPT